MRCDSVREKIHHWFDKPGAAAIPEEVGQHLKVCAECRVFISRWNAIELRMQSMREETPELSPGFQTRLAERLQKVAPMPRRPLLIQYWRWTAVGMATMLLIALFLMRGMIGFDRHGASANRIVRPSTEMMRPAPLQRTGEPPAVPLSSDMPMANTAR
jgi:predicted anti-sigma-YlaC factor YlaD